VDPITLRAIIDCRYDVLARYAKSLKRVFNEELGTLKDVSPEDARRLQVLEPWLDRDEKLLHEGERAQIAATLARTRALYTAYSMRRELAALWARSTASRDQLVRQLQDWCQRAEASGIRPLAEFSRQLRSYA
jgi:stearoyl-CoA desaturase (delta-9 desaturase)